MLLFHNIDYFLPIQMVDYVEITSTHSNLTPTGSPVLPPFLPFHLSEVIVMRRASSNALKDCRCWNWQPGPPLLWLPRAQKTKRESANFFHALDSITVIWSKKSHFLAAARGSTEAHVCISWQQNHHKKTPPSHFCIDAEDSRTT